METQPESTNADECRVDSSVSEPNLQRASEPALPRKLPGAIYFPMRREQASMAALLVICVIGMGFYFWHRNIVENGLIDIDRAEHVKVEYLIDINHAPWPAIANLPGIGPKLAKEIVRFREQDGLFEQIEDIKKIHGIGDAKLTAILEYIAPISPTVAADGDSTNRN